MEKRIAAVYGGTDAQVGELRVNRVLPNRYIHAVGPFIFLDHIYPFNQYPKTPSPKDGKHAHPHRGIATFSYLFSGELEHFDSAGNHGIVKAGGAQWMKAGNGVIHDEGFTADFERKGGVFHGLQFWVNLPSENKAEDPDYFGLQSEDVPEVTIAGGKLRVIIGEFAGEQSPVQTYTQQFIYHIKLDSGTDFIFEANKDLEYAIFLPAEGVAVNNQVFAKSELLAFEEAGTEIHLANKGSDIADIILFGGAPYEEPIVAEGPFVMNTRSEIADAYSGFFNGNYGKINYNNDK
ncbi:pirin family protein [Desertivirga brevis]|uniref:pirin family protein n=1 Tax=Desertivirga brevis TaxID=2810310 RepID=UPI001A971E76|nr:pirin family protein [Pedobacter sp. SYSU D00873]